MLILKLMLNRDSEIVICSRFVNCDLVIRTQPSGPLCLWQCLLKMTSDDAVGKSHWKETVFYKSTCIQTPFKKMTNGANMQQTYKQLCLAVKPHPPLPHEPTPRLGGRPILVSFSNPLALETHLQGQVCWGNWLHPGWLGDPGGEW